MKRKNQTPRSPMSPLRTGLLCLLLALGGCASDYAPAAAPGSAAANQSMKERQRIAGEMFRERCKKSGVFIHRTVEDVEGIFVMKLRPDGLNYGDQYKLDDPYGSDSAGKGYIHNFLRGSFEATHKYPDSFTPPLGYLYVEAIDPADGVRYRYTGSVKAVRKMKIDAPNVQLELKRDPNFDLNIYDYVLDRVAAKGLVPRYGVTYDDISTKEERDYWIAGSSLKVIDLQTNEVIAERIGYMVDWAQGIRLGGRSPWLLAANNACPEFAPRHGSSAQPRQASNFVQKVLKPSEKK
ncbi:hypothetical protein [Acidovorax sp. NCPPB 3576]|uniref:hypothetical protein n=1 Tax=Acidovorax sp. NCPPB 3576 TaxID=2940488 RepID=UPI00234ACB6F|nr:hypothetical protein [Acidovorax sp. NCPPB 3576]WCM90224.1 hypothetical protein M5C98_09510 [Acidovorax sp. NCPPB 3576]